MSLPFGVSRQTDGAAGHDTGAPKKPLLATKVIIPSLLAVVFWAAVYLIIDSVFRSGIPDDALLCICSNSCSTTNASTNSN